MNDLAARTLQSVGQSQAKTQLRRKLTIWDTVLKEKHDQDLAIENRNSAARSKLKHETADFQKT